MAAACHHFKPESPHCQVGPSRVLYLDSETSWLVYLDFKTGQVVDIDFSTSLVVFLDSKLNLSVQNQALHILQKDLKVEPVPSTKLQDFTKSAANEKEVTKLDLKREKLASKLKMANREETKRSARGSFEERV